jgi:hypothetical protein
VRRHARDHHARVPAMPVIRSAQSPPDKGGDARPTREDALRWVHDNAMADGSCAPLAAALAGDVLRTAACTFWKAARKLRWVCKVIRTGSGLEARPQAAADGAREAATPTANAAGLQPTQDDGAKTPSGHQQPQAMPSSWCSNQCPVGPYPQSPPAQAHLHRRTTGRCPAQLVVEKKENEKKRTGASKSKT